MEMDGGSPIVTAGSMANMRAHRSHSEAERKRRQRINGHLNTLRTLIPAATRMDKATLLGEVVRHVRELHALTDDVALVVPTEVDDVLIEGEEEGNNRVRASVCCSDRPGLMSEMNQAFSSVQARAVRAEISTVGGRTKSIMEVEFGAELRAEESRSGLFAALRSVLGDKKPGSVDLFGSHCKRQCLSTRLAGE